ncbi:MAG: DNA methyltransferase [Verrucomicrobiota bacterium]
MPLSWNEIRHNAVKFARDHKHSTSESADKQTFWNEFFDVFGLSRKLVASFEVPVLKASGNFGKIDLLWKRKLLVEHKSAGEDLGRAKTQAFDYIQAMAAEGREKEIPRYVIVSDFQRFVLYDLEPETQRDLPLFAGRRYEVTEFALAELHKHIHAFSFIPGYKQHTFKEQDPINIEAAEILGKLHDELEAGGYTGHDLERFLVRILFCLFAEDTGLFPREAFKLYIENHTQADGSDLGLHLARLFEILNKPVEKRQTNLDEDLAQFPYVNGDLFADALGFADFNRNMRDALLECCAKNWDEISPAIFGSLFQSIMQPKERRQIGAHYTSERDILKVARSLFLDDLRAEFEARKKDKSTGRIARLEEFHKKLCSLRFLDPACGCGNFLVITYRELRQLELETLQELFGGQRELTLDEVNRVSAVDVHQFYGIEIEEWPSRIAEVAMWLMDHQMNVKISEAFGQLYQRLPLKKSPHIHCANALRKDWREVLPPDQCSYVLGNPPFVGKQYMTSEQNADMELVCGDVKGHGLLDFVTAWYFKAAEYIKGTQIVVGFVSTNSITQGEQVGILWKALFQHGLKIHFGHRTFPWVSEARGMAHVHVVIIGFAAVDSVNKRIYDYESDSVTVAKAKNISPYLVEGSDKVVTKSSKPLCNVPEIVFGSMPNDGGYLLLDDKAKAELLAKEPAAAKFIRPFLGSEEFINGLSRWCLWLADASPQELRDMTEVMKRVDAVREQRLKSSRETTRELAKFPTRFGEIRQPVRSYLAVPEVSSERRAYIPIAFLPPKIIASNKLYTISGASQFTFGVLTSVMHMAWTRQVTGRLESRYQYSGKIVYNNFPWPESATDKQRDAVEEKAQAVLDARKPHLPPQGMSTLADLYDPLSMPPELVKAHTELDRAVEKCYRPEPFNSDRERVEFLFSLYEKLTAPLLPATPSAKGRRSSSSSLPAKPRKLRTPGLPGQI